MSDTCVKHDASAKYDAVLKYKTALSVFHKWLADGLLSRSEFSAIEAKIAEKYGLSLSSIFRPIELTNCPKRANID